MTITISRFTWDECEPHEVNTLSGINYAESRESLDIKDYLIGGIEVNAKAEGIKGGYEADELLPRTVQSNLSLMDDEARTLYDFFMVSGDTRLIKWKFNYIYDGVLKYELWLHPTDIKYDTSLEARDMSIELYGFEREFREYFSEVELPDANTFNWTQTTSISGFMAMTVTDFFGQLLSVPVEVVGLPNWYIFGAGAVSAGAGGQSAGGQAGALLHVPSSEEYYLWKNCYERAKSSGDKVYPFLKKDCAGSGWLFYFEYDGGKRLIIRPRDCPSLDLHDLYYFGDGTYIGAESHSEGKEHENIYDAIVINNGRLYGGDGAFSPTFIRLGEPSVAITLPGLKGATPIVIRDVEPNYRSEFFNRIEKLASDPFAHLTGTGTLTLTGVMNGLFLSTFSFEGDFDLNIPYPVPSSGTVTGTITGTIEVTGTGGNSTHTGEWNVSLTGNIAELKSGGLTMTSLVGSFINGSPSLINSTSGSMETTGVIEPPTPLYIYELYFTTIEGYAYYKYGGEDDKVFRLLGYTNQEPFGGFRVLNDLTEIKKDRILFIDAGHNSVQETKVNLGGGGHGLYHSENFGGAIPPQQSELVFSGNNASMFFQYDGTNITDYPRYCESEEFRNNFRFFKKGEVRVMNYVYDGILTSLSKKVRFIEERGGDAIPFPERVWDIRGLHIDFISETTTLELVA